ncbi:hypothetical protein T4D_3972 [Trichinella pseudospiralis]|uniref:Uncharacterized protein n=1 Tax=Trichinella pseudospiralis TaxID=6337 RepID=A0A0V1F234_TRIPS|nr:hypothetical protein T4D_3972 [Trichinella pseudospiralis]
MLRLVEATPQAMPQAEYRKFRIFKNIAPGFAPRLRLRPNKNLHIPSGCASGNFFAQYLPLGAYANFYSPSSVASGQICKFI